MLSGYNELKRNISQRAPWIFAALGFFYFAVSLWHASQYQISVLDEGLYLFKGWLFSSGVYQPFQPYGPWTNQMPFAFYIPGWLQQVFGPSLASGRFVAVGLGLLTYIGLTLTLRKFANWKITSILMIFFAINSAQTKMIAIATSQGLIACLTTWSFYFLFGNSRRIWYYFVSGLLAGLTVMIRINMIPLLPLMLVFVFWEKGFKAALWNLVGIGVFFIGGHAFLWPEILQIWVKWIPLPFMSAWFAPKTIPTWQPDNPFGFRIASFFLGFRYHFVALVGGFLSFGFLNQKALNAVEKWKTTLFLLATFAVLFMIHLWAALLNDYCVFCFPTYITFFANIGFILAAISLTHLDASNKVRSAINLFALTGILAGIAYSAEEIFFATLGDNAYKIFFNLPVPFTNASLWQLFANKFGLEQSALLKLSNSVFPIFITLFAIGIFSVIYLFLQKGGFLPKRIGHIGLVFALSFAVAIFTPSKLLAGGYNTYDCELPTVANYDRIGEEISTLVPNGASLYWAGYSPVTLLHIPQAVIYPAQLHSGYSYRISEDDDALLQYGWWNESLASRWANVSGFILVEAKNEPDTAVITDGFADYKIIYRSDPQNCRQDSEMLLYRRNQ